MICKPYRAVIPASTCISRQHIIETLSDKQSCWHNVGPEIIIHDACKKCSKGRTLYAKAKAEGNLPEIKRRKYTRAKKADIDIVAYHEQNAWV